MTYIRSQRICVCGGGERLTLEAVFGPGRTALGLRLGAGSEVAFGPEEEGEGSGQGEGEEGEAGDMGGSGDPHRGGEGGFVGRMGSRADWRQRMEE